MTATRRERFVCWWFDHDFGAGVGIGWTGYVQLICKRCGHSERRHHAELRR